MVLSFLFDCCSTNKAPQRRISHEGTPVSAHEVVMRISGKSAERISEKAVDDHEHVKVSVPVPSPSPSHDEVSYEPLLLRGKWRSEYEDAEETEVQEEVKEEEQETEAAESIVAEPEPVKIASPKNNGLAVDVSNIFSADDNASAGTPIRDSTGNLSFDVDDE